jgi:vitamin B12 transporter
MFPSFLPRPLGLLLLFSTAGVSAAHAQDRLTVVLVDQEGGTLPRAHVRLLAADGSALAQGLADARGELRFDRDACAGCRVEASLPGFEPANAPADRTPVRLTLTIGPIREAVVVSATRGEAPASQVGSALTVVDAEEIERRGTPLVSELLRSTPGVAVARVGGLGNVTSMFVRGGESSYNKVLLDGIPLNEPGGTFDFSNLTTQALDRVEVLRGAHSALFGTDAMASVVQLVTRRSKRPNLLASLEAGSYASTRAAATAGTAEGRWDVTGHASRQQTDNRTPNNEFRNTTVSLNGGAQASPDFAIRFVARGELGHTGSPGAAAFGRPDMDAYYRRKLGVGGISAQHYGGPWQQRATYALTVSDHQSTNLLVDPPYTPTFDGRSAPFAFSDFTYDSGADLHRHHASYQVDRRIGATGIEHLVTGALEWDGERARLRNRMAGTLVSASRDNVGAAIQHQLLARRLSLTTGLRIERNDSFGTAVVPRVSFAFMLRESSGPAGDTRLKANAGGGVKEPTINQSFSPSPSFLGNPDLEPERARTADVGVEQRLFGNRAKVEFTGFYGRFQNIISTRTISFSPFMSQYFNIGLTHASGAELAAELAPLRGLTIRGGYTFLDSEVTESTAPLNPVFAPGNALFRRPRHSGFADVAWSKARISLDLHGTFVGRRVDSDFASFVPPLLFNDGYTAWDLGASCRVAARVTAFARVENLGDADYMEPLGYPAWRRSARAGVKVGF